VGLGRGQILVKWWEFANIDPKLTRDSGQSKGLDSLWKALGVEGSMKPGMRMPEPEPDILPCPVDAEARPT
jgi:hypothetical protein